MENRPPPSKTEATVDSVPIDRLSRSAALTTMLDGQIAAVDSLRGALPAIEAGAVLMAETLGAGGRVAYAAAGSSGLMGLADGVELPGTFGVDPGQILILMAGGVPEDGVMPNAAEDDEAAAEAAVNQLSAGDLIVALSASGTTPYPCAVARLGRAKGLRVIAIANNAGAPLLGLADVAICAPTPPEVLAGSTRLGAGTAQKVALNMMSTLAGVLMGHVHSGMMVNVVADNAKLVDRARRIVAAIAGVEPDAAAAALDQTQGRVKPAVLVARGMTVDEAAAVLTGSKGQLRPCLAALETT